MILSPTSSYGLTCGMSAFRTLSVVRPVLYNKILARPFSIKAPTGTISKGTFVMASTVAGLMGYGILYQYHGYSSTKEEACERYSKAKTLKRDAEKTPTFLTPGGPPASQPSVWTQGKNHALYLWIHLKLTANVKEVAKIAANLQKMVDTVVDPEMKDDEDEVLAGVGFGPNFYAQVADKTMKRFVYLHRKGPLGEMPSTGGDVFVHAKCNQVSKLFELCQLFLRSLPKDSVEKAEDIYSFVYQNGRDLSGFIDGTENRADDEGRQEVAVEPETGGSYVITQKWIHNLNVINTTKTKTLESWVGRERGDSTELAKKSTTSRVARMTEGANFQAPKPVEILRQSMPFGTVCGEAGLFFIGYTADPSNFEYMLDRMVGAGGDGLSDDIMRLSKNVQGTYWYFPGEKDLAKLV